jgi:SAM-dependent methyltransferase
MSVLSSLVANARRKFGRRGRAPTHEQCGLRDLSAAGWFNAMSGELVAGFPLGPDDTYLDVGCGTGGMAMFAANRGCRVIATDISETAIAALDRNLKAANATDYRCLVSDSNPLPLPDGVATRVTCSEVMEHVRDPRQFLGELVRVGAPGALYLLTVPDPASEAVNKELAPASYWQEPNHVRIFGRDEFADAVTGAGLTIEARHYFGFYVAVWWSLFWSVARGDEQPMLAAWTETWAKVLAHRDGHHIQQALDRAMPKSQAIVARKAA